MGKILHEDEFPRVDKPNLDIGEFTVDFGVMDRFR